MVFRSHAVPCGLTHALLTLLDLVVHCGKSQACTLQAYLHQVGFVKCFCCTSVHPDAVIAQSHSPVQDPSWLHFTKGVRIHTPLVERSKFGCCTGEGDADMTAAGHILVRNIVVHFVPYESGTSLRYKLQWQRLLCPSLTSLPLFGCRVSKVVHIRKMQLRLHSSCSSSSSWRLWDLPSKQHS